ncbi:MAG: HEAT repeat domain-containing protein, partial [Candidatus Poribacteria bacterium]
MVGETLRDKALSNKHGIIYKSDYDSLNGVFGIISDYLFKQIEQFGDKRQYVEKILMELTSASGTENDRLTIRDIDDLSREIDLTPRELEDLLYKMSQRWMIRHLGSGRYELIHDKLAEQVYKNLIVARKELEFKLIKEHISAVANIYQLTSIILNTSVMARIYLDRNRINPNFSEKMILLHSCIAQKGPAWFWFKNSYSSEYLPIFYAGLSNPLIQLDVIKILGYAKDEKVVPELLKLSKDSEEILCTVIETLGNIGSQESIPMLMDKLNDNSLFVRVASAIALSKLGAKEAIPKLINMIKEERQNVQKIVLLAYFDLVGQEDITELKEMFNSGNIYTKAVSISVLAKLLREQFIPELDELLKDKNRYVRISAVHALEYILKRKQEECINNEYLFSSIKASFRSMLQDRSKEVRTEAFKVLVEFCSWEDIPLFVSMLESDIP